MGNLDELLLDTKLSMLDEGDLLPDSYQRKGAGGISEMVVDRGSPVRAGVDDSYLSAAAPQEQTGQGASPLEMLLKGPQRDWAGEEAELLAQREELLRQIKEGQGVSWEKTLGRTLGAILPALLSKGAGAEAGLGAVQQGQKADLFREEQNRKIALEDLYLNRDEIKALQKERRELEEGARDRAFKVGMEGLKQKAMDERTEFIQSQANERMAYGAAQADARLEKSLAMAGKNLDQRTASNARMEKDAIKKDFDEMASDLKERAFLVNRIEQILYGPENQLGQLKGILKAQVARGLAGEKGALAVYDIKSTSPDTLRGDAIGAYNYLSGATENPLTRQQIHALKDYLSRVKTKTKYYADNAKAEVIKRNKPGSRTLVALGSFDDVVEPLGSSLFAALGGAPDGFEEFSKKFGFKVSGAKENGE